MARADSIVKMVRGFYLASSEFKGMPAVHLDSKSPKTWKQSVRALVAEGRLEVRTPDLDPNPSIKRLPITSVEPQLEALDSATRSEWVCLYPSGGELDGYVDRAKYDGRPYMLALALGSAQLSYRAFDLRILETYRNDPRYHYECNDLHGSLGVRDQHYESESMAEKDKVLLPSFGFGFDDSRGRAVIAFVADLADLSPEHQRIWQAHELSTNVRMHDDFFRSQVLGEFPKNLSICEAFFMELETINDMAVAMARAPIFRNIKRPKRFGFLLRPTQHELEQFVHLLDKTLSENIDRKFFRADVEFEREKSRGDGKVVIEQKGSLQILTEWLGVMVRTPDPRPLDEMLATFRKVRKLRQAPAHALNDDDFDAEIFKRQRELLLDAYQAVRTLRLILTNHPAAATIEVNPLLRAGMILDF